MSTVDSPRWAAELGTVPAHRALVHAVAILDDGDTCVSAAEDGGDLAVVSLAQLAVLDRLPGHSGPVNWVAAQRGTGVVVSGGDDATVRVWDVPARRQLRVLRGHTHFVRQVAVAAGRIVSGAQDGTVRVWDLASGECRYVFDRHGADVMAVAISADGRIAASASMDNAVLIWDLDRGELAYPLYDTQSTVLRFAAGEVYKAVPGPGADPKLHRECPTYLSLDADGGELVSAESEVLWWELATGAERYRIAGRGTTIRSAARHPDGRGVFLGGPYGVELWHPDGAPTPSLTDADTSALALTPDGSTLVAGTTAGRLVLLRSTVDTVSSPRNAGTVTRLAVGADGRYGASGDVAGTVVLWDLVAARPVAQVYADAGRYPDPCCVFTADGERLVVPGGGGLTIVDAATGARLRRLADPAGDAPLISALALLPDGTVLAGALGEGLHRWHLDTGEVRRYQGRTRQIREIALAAGGRLAFTIGWMAPEGQPDSAPHSEALQCWDVAGGRLLWTRQARPTPLGRPGPEIAFVAPVPGDRTVISQSRRSAGTLALWRTTDGRLQRELPVSGRVIAHHWAPDGTLLVSALDSDRGDQGLHRVAPDLSAVLESVPVERPALTILPGARYALARDRREYDLRLVDLSDDSVLARCRFDAIPDRLAVTTAGDTALVADREHGVHVLRIGL
jgi:WD40 repeat protein